MLPIEEMCAELYFHYGQVWLVAEELNLTREETRKYIDLYFSMVKAQKTLSRFSYKFF